MKIEFENEDELISGILSSNVNLTTVIVYLLDYCGATLNKTNLNAVINREARTREARQRLQAWVDSDITVYTLKDIPNWITEEVLRSSTYKNIFYAIDDIVKDISPNAQMAKNYIKVHRTYYFNQEGLIFLIDRFCVKGFLTHEHYEKWRRESGFFDFLYK